MTDSITKVVDLAAPISRVWQALTDHQEFGEWFRAKVDRPFEVGDTQQVSSTYPEYVDQPWEMRIERMDPERLFSFKWGDIGCIAGDADTPPTLVEFRLETSSKGTRLTIVESGFDALPDTRRHDIFRDNTEGWSQQVRNIIAYVDT